MMEIRLTKIIQSLRNVGPQPRMGTTRIVRMLRTIRGRALWVLLTVVSKHRLQLKHLWRICRFKILKAARRLGTRRWCRPRIKLPHWTSVHWKDCRNKHRRRRSVDLYNQWRRPPMTRMLKSKMTVVKLFAQNPGRAPPEIKDSNRPLSLRIKFWMRFVSLK